MALAVVWTLGPGLIFVPRGLARLGSLPDGRSWRLCWPWASLPPLGSHLLVHFGVAGYSFHYLPALVALMAVGIGRAPIAPSRDLCGSGPGCGFGAGGDARRRSSCSIPADIERPGWRGTSTWRWRAYTRVGLHAEVADRAPRPGGPATRRRSAFPRSTSLKSGRIDGDRHALAARARRYDRPGGVDDRDDAPALRTMAMTARTGVILRLLGPMIEVGCLSSSSRSATGGGRSRGSRSSTRSTPAWRWASPWWSSGLTLSDRARDGRATPAEGTSIDEHPGRATEAAPTSLGRGRGRPPRAGPRTYRYYDLIMAAFVTILICSNLISAPEAGGAESRAGSSSARGSCSSRSATCSATS